MPKISDLIREAGDEPKFSFEYFPPRQATGVENLKRRMPRMAAQRPLYADVTFGAGGGTRDGTLELCKVLEGLGVPANMHLTCTNMPAETVAAALADAKEAGIQNIVALRGDPPVGQEEWTATEGGFTCALDLIKYIRETHGDFFCVSTAGYPEGHPSVIHEIPAERELSAAEQGRVVEMGGKRFVCSDADYAKEMAYLKQKVDAGADLIITQMVFDADVFIKFVKDCRDLGITVPILPGIMCIQNWRGFDRMTAFCKSRVPAALRTRVEAVKDEGDDVVKRVAVEVATDMCRAILDSKTTPVLHFYTLNLEKVVNGVLVQLGIAEAAPEAMLDDDAGAMKGTILSASYDEVGRKRQLEKLEAERVAKDASEAPSQ